MVKRWIRAKASRRRLCAVWDLGDRVRQIETGRLSGIQRQEGQELE